MKKYTSFMPITLVLFTLMGGWAFAEADGTANLREKAVQMFRQGRYDDAVLYYRQLAVLQPTNTETLKDLMWAQWQAKRYRETIETTRKVLEQTPSDSEALNLMARAQVASGDKAEGLRSFQKSLALSPDNTEIRNTVNMLLSQTRNEETALTDITQTKGSTRERANMYARLGQTQVRKGDYSSAAETWVEAAQEFPENVTFQFQAARSLYFSGQQDKAIARLKTLLMNNPGYWPAVDFLVDDAIVRGEQDMVEELLENNFSEFRIEDEPRILKLATLYETNGKLTKCLKTLDRFLNVNPTNGDALLMRGEVLMAMKRYLEASETFEKVAQLNPWSHRARLGAAEAYSAAGKPTQALRITQEARKMDPTNPTLILREAQFVYESGRGMESKAMLEDWIKENPEPAVPVLLYHGLTQNKRDPMLAYTIHMTTAAFEDQMSALAQKHFTPITAEQMDGWSRWLRSLPPKPILITFDDGRIDSFKLGDPILERYGMRVTMFAIGATLDANLSGYANWEQFKEYIDTGRWQAQGHADQGHSYIPIDAEGRQSLFLANRLWIDKEKRLETSQEWADRILSDHRSLKKKFLEHFGKSPIAYSFPEGQFGQDKLPNDPQAGTLNLVLARKNFGTTYHQDNYGLNVRSRDSMLLTRLEPKASWSGEKLVQHLTDSQPKIMMYRRLLKQAAWDERIHEAYAYLKKVKDNGATRGVELADEARIRYAAGEYTGAKRYAQRSLTIDKDPDIERILQNIHLRERPTWRPSIFASQDNRDRDQWQARNDLDFKLVGNTRLNLHQLFGQWREAGTPDVEDTGLGVGLSKTIGLHHSFSGSWTGHRVHGLSNKQETYSAYGLWRAKWTDTFTTEIDGGRSLYDSARAINARVFEREGRVRAEWLSEDTVWQTRFRGRYVDLSDHNQRWTGETQGSYRFFPHVLLRGVYRLTIDNMKEINPNYYSPQQVVLNQLGLQYNTARGRPLEAFVYYLPGVGTERNVKAELVHSVECGLNYRRGETFEISPWFSLTTTPTYNRQTYGVSLKKVF